jgi:hypothetical protein
MSGQDRKSTAPKPFVFVLMPFDDRFDDIYKFGIKGAADDVGAYAERLDDQIFVEGILDRIFNQISKADVVVADMTGRNPNVFYEVGYAHALGKLVILLTQNTDDIPFDLKHRQHTVYGGKIDLLRNELSSKLQWAIAEAKRQGNTSGPEHFSLRLAGVEVPQSSSTSEFAIIRAEVPSSPFYLPIQLRNDSYQASSGITHVYLFAAADSLILPCSDSQAGDSVFGLGQTFFPPTKRLGTALRRFRANPLDANDGLTDQYRLGLTFPALPAGAVEISRIPLLLTPTVVEGQSNFRLRLHSAVQYHEYLFTLSIKVRALPVVHKVEESNIELLEAAKFPTIPGD